MHTLTMTQSLHGCYQALYMYIYIAGTYLYHSTLYTEPKL